MRCLAVCLVLAALLGMINENSMAELLNPEALKEQITLQKEKVRSLDRQISHKRTVKKEVDTRKRSVLEELNRLEKRISEQWNLLQDTRKKQTEVELQLMEITSKIDRLKKENLEMRRLVEQRLRALREMGTLGVLNVLFASETFPELMSREANLRLILNYDRQTRMIYAEKLNRLENEEKLLEEKARELAGLEQEIKAAAEALEKSRDERRKIYGKLDRESREYARLIAEMKEAKASLQNIISGLVKSVERAERMQQEAIEQARTGAVYSYRQGVMSANASSEGFAGNLGRLITPAPGIVVVPSPDYGGGDVAGVVFACPWGSRIKAVYDGKVVYKKTLPGYGNMIIIDHGDKFFTLTGQAVKFFKEPGDSVLEGETIGLSGGGPWIEEGIYFEVRHGDRQENPLQWLDLRGVKVIYSK